MAWNVLYFMLTYTLCNMIKLIQHCSFLGPFQLELTTGGSLCCTTIFNTTVRCSSFFFLGIH